MVYFLTNGAGESAESAEEAPPRNFSWAGYFLYDVSDWRLPLYAGSLTTRGTNGVFLFVKSGMFEDAVWVSTNECPTAEDAFKKFGIQRMISRRRQIRIVQRDAIFQTSVLLTTNSAVADKRVLTMPLNDGDVLIYTGMKF